MTTVDHDEVDLTDADRVSIWLSSSEGATTVRRTLRQLKLPESFDSDLVVKTIHAAERMASRGEPIESVPAWAKRTLCLRGLDLLSSPRSSRATVRPEEAEGFGIEAEPAGGAARAGADIAGLLAAMESDDIRRNIANRWHRAQLWRISATLTYLSVALDGCAPGRDCPAPIGGADEFDAAQWAGLFYAQQLQCFPEPGGNDTNSIRQRRKRRIDDVREVLVDAYRATHRDGDHG